MIFAPSLGYAAAAIPDPAQPLKHYPKRNQSCGQTLDILYYRRFFRYDAPVSFAFLESRAVPIYTKANPTMGADMYEGSA